MVTTIDRPTLTCPTKMPQAPNASTAGARLGNRLMMPILRLRSARMSTPEMRIRASVVPTSMLSMLRLEMCENMMAPLDATPNISAGALARSQPSARAARPRISCVETLARVAVRRVADLSRLIWLFRSRP